MKTPEELPDFYAGELNAKRIKKYTDLSEMYNLDKSTVADIFCKGIDFATQTTEKHFKAAPQLNRQALETAWWRGFDAYTDVTLNPPNIDDLIDGGSDGWISVESEEPDYGIKIMIWNDFNEQTIIYYDVTNDIKFQWWQPLPTPPQTIKK